MAGVYQLYLTDNQQNPLTGSRVSLVEYAPPYEFGNIANPIVSYGGSTSTFADNNGTASFHNIIPGVYRISFTNAGFISQSVSLYTNNPETIFYVNVQDASGSTVNLMNYYIPPSSSFSPFNSFLSSSYSSTSSYATLATSASYFSGSISNAVTAISSSYALTASFALNGGGSGTNLITGSTYPITASWAIQAQTASTLNPVADVQMNNFNLTGANNIGASTVQANGVGFFGLGTNILGIVSASHANNADSSLIAINALNAASANVSVSSSYSATSSIALSQNSVSSSYALTASYAQSGVITNAISSSYASTASIAISALNTTTLFTGSTYPITASWSNNSVSTISSSWASQSLTSTSASWASQSISSSFANTSISSAFATNAINAINASDAVTAISSAFATNAGNATLSNTASYVSGSASQLRGAESNLGIKYFSQLGGNNPNVDYLTQTASYEGQLGIACYGNRAPFLFSALKAGATGSDWFHSFNFPCGVGVIGDPSNMDPTLVGGSVLWHFNGSPNGRTAMGDAVLSIANWSQVYNSSGTQIGLSVMGIDNTGSAILINSNQNNYAAVPSNKTPGLLPGTTYFILGPDNANSKLWGVAQYGNWAPDLGNYLYFITDFTTGQVRIPAWQQGVYQPTDVSYVLTPSGSVNAGIGDLYTNNGYTYAIVNTDIHATPMLNPTSVGTLVKQSGTGDASITYILYTNNSYGNYVFLSSGFSVSPTAGATYKNNGLVYTVTNVNSNTISTTISGAPTTTGSLSRLSGSGDININYTSWTTSSWQDVQTWSPSSGTTILYGDMKLKANIVQAVGHVNIINKAGTINTATFDSASTMATMFTPITAVSFNGTSSAIGFVGTSSWAINALTASNVVSSSYSLTSSFSLNSAGGSGTTLFTGSTYQITSSRAITSSFATTASFALNGGSGGTTLFTASTYQITSSRAITSSFASTSLLANTSTNSTTASYVTLNGNFLAVNDNTAASSGILFRDAQGDAIIMNDNTFHGILLEDINGNTVALNSTGVLVVSSTDILLNAVTIDPSNNVSGVTQLSVGNIVATSTIEGTTITADTGFSGNGANISSLSANNINAGTIGNSFLPAQISVTGVSASFFGTSSWSRNSLTASNLSLNSNLPYRAGQLGIGNLATSANISFSAALPNTSYAVSIISDASLASAVSFGATGKTVTGFTASLSAGIAGGTTLDWIAWRNN